VMNNERDIRIFFIGNVGLEIVCAILSESRC
jgi:hypothetical protein